jgi:malate dehydrogenase (oxaloacetate-decarboxylating)
MDGISVVMSGAGAAGVAVVKLLIAMGLRDVVLCDRAGAVYRGRPGLDPVKAELAGITNRSGKTGKLADVIRGADVFIGVSAPGLLSEDMVRSMAKDPILFPMSNPTPEIMPDLALRAGAAVVGTGRSDFANQINNVLAFPGIFRGALDARASDINECMKIAAARAISDLIPPSELSPDKIVPDAFDPRLRDAVAAAVANAARESGAVTKR